MDRRKYVNYLTAKQLRDNFLQPCYDNDINTHIIIGNHDTFYKNTNDFNSMNELAQAYKKNVTWYSEPTEVIFGQEKIALMPWINPGNHESCIDFINKTDSKILLGHLELAGFGMYKGVINEHGMDSSIFSKFSFVGSGHYHHRSKKGNIQYLGAPFEITWSDYDDERGFHIFDSTNNTLKYYKNPFTIFEKVLYDDSNLNEQDLEEADFSYLKDKIVKVIDINKTKPYLFDRIIDKIEKSGVLELQVVNDHLNSNELETEDIIDENADTFQIINEYIDNSGIKNSSFVKQTINEIYAEAFQK